MIASPNVELRAEALKLGGKWKLESLRKSLETAATSEAENEAARCGALEGLATFADANAAEVLQRLAANNSSPRIATAAIVNELTIDDANAAKDTAKFLASAVDDADAENIFSAFLRRPKALPVLARAFTTNRPTADAAKIGLRRMSAMGRADEHLLTVLIDAAGLQREKRQLSATDIAALAEDVRKNGRAANGARIYARAELSCAACHAINGKGGNIGPDLSALGTAQPIEFIIGAILSPNREVKEGFTAIEVTTKSGEAHQGYLVRENAQELVLKDIAAAQEIRLAKADLASRQQRGSVMPEGLADTLTQSEFRDLVRFLSDLGR
jgi:putative heme-binding domain-containing protein